MNAETKEFLDIAVLQERKPVTYRLLARRQKIHVDAAKEILEQYAAGQPEVHAIYCLSGTLNRTLGYKLQLVHDTELDHAKKKFTQLTASHVYCILPYKPKDLSVLVAVNRGMPEISLQDRVECGLLQNANVSNVAQKPGKSLVPLSSSSEQSKPVPTTATASASATKASTHLTPRTATDKSKTVPSKRKSTLSFSSNDTKTKRLATEQQQKQKQKQDQDMDVLDDSSGNDMSDEEVDRRLAEVSNTQPLEIFSDDEDETPQKPAKAADEKTHPTPSDMTHDQSDAMDIEESAPDAPEPEEETKELIDTPTPGKVRRRITKKVTYRDERGYMVTKDVTEWETVDDTSSGTKTLAPQSENKPSPSSKPTKANAGSKKSSGQQQSLLSFWGKRG